MFHSRLPITCMSPRIKYLNDSSFNFDSMCLRQINNQAIAVLFAAVARCQDTLEDETRTTNVDDRKEKRGISLNLAPGLEGYSYLGPSSYSRGINNRGYVPVTEYGKIVKLKLMFDAKGSKR